MSTDDQSTVGPDDPEFDVDPADEEFADSVPYDESFGEIMVNGGRIYLPDRFGLRDDADRYGKEADEEVEPVVFLDWNGIQDDYACLNKDHAISLAIALMEAVRQM